MTNNKKEKELLSPVIHSDDGTSATCDREKSELFASHLQQCHQISDHRGFNEAWRDQVETFVNERPTMFQVNMTDTYDASEAGDDDFLLQSISVEEITSTLISCKNKSAAGDDGINYLMLKKLPKNVFQAIAKIFNACLKTGYFPIAWKNASVTMIPKPGKDKKRAKNHRPISLLPCLGKVYERIIAKRLSSHMEINKLFSPFQSGFRKGHMCAEQLFRLVEETCHSIKQREITAALFLDAEAAFDKAWHDGIRFKLHELKLPQRLIRLISSFLSNRTLNVKLKLAKRLQELFT